MREFRSEILAGLFSGCPQSVHQAETELARFPYHLGKTRADFNRQNATRHVTLGILPDCPYACYCGTERSHPETHERMNNPNRRDHLANYIRIHRARTGMSQGELGQLLGYRDAETVARHERFAAVPPLEIAIGYEIVFRVPVAEIFAGLRSQIEVRVETSLTEFEEQLGQRSARDRHAHATARKLIWLKDRKNTSTAAPL
jgi:DNA-binding XRE family transcriptional regulator